MWCVSADHEVFFPLTPSTLDSSAKGEYKFLVLFLLIVKILGSVITHSKRANCDYQIPTLSPSRRTHCSASAGSTHVSSRSDSLAIEL